MHGDVVDRHQPVIRALRKPEHRQCPSRPGVPSSISPASFIRLFLSPTISVAFSHRSCPASTEMLVAPDLMLARLGSEQATTLASLAGLRIIQDPGTQNAYVISGYTADHRRYQARSSSTSRARPLGSGRADRVGGLALRPGGAQLGCRDLRQVSLIEDTADPIGVLRLGRRSRCASGSRRGWSAQSPCRMRERRFGAVCSAIS